MSLTVADEGSSRVVLIDDQVSYADAFSVALSIVPDIELVGRATNREDAVSRVLHSRPDLVLCDYRLPAGETGIMVATELRESGFRGPILILTGFLAPQVLRESAALDDVTALSKDTPITLIVTTMRALLTGDPLPEQVLEQTPEATILSPGELEVLECLTRGETPAEIAADLHLSLHTIRARIKFIHRKLGVTSQVEAVAKGIQSGLVVPP